MNLRVGMASISMLALCCTSCLDSDEVQMVKNGSLNSCPGQTVEKMVNSYMGSPSWESGKSADGQVFVNVSGDITYQEKPVRAVVQFFLDGQTFSFNAIELNGVPSPNLLAFGLMGNMCESVKK
jgi:hypothetical protein